MFKLSYPENGSFYYATHGSAGFDICSNENIVLHSMDGKTLSTGLFIEAVLDLHIDHTRALKMIPYIQIISRSGLIMNHGITVFPTVIDKDYSGEIKVPIMNFGKYNYVVNKGDRIAQGVCMLAHQLECLEVKDVVRGTNGFGSSGK